MPTSGPVIIVEDDAEDNKLILLAFKGNQPDTLAGLTNDLKTIVDYWRKCRLPSKN
jgi:hypothetical protein